MLNLAKNHLYAVLAIAVMGTSQVSFAQIQACQDAAKKSPEKCEQIFRSAVTSANSADQALARSSNTATARISAEQLNEHTKMNAEMYGTAIRHCEEKRRVCADTCSAVRGTPQVLQQAEKLKHDCFGKVNRTIQMAQQGVSSNSAAALQAATSGNTSGQAGAETIEGNVHRAAAGETVWGIGTLPDGRTVNVPSHDIDAFKAHYPGIKVIMPK